MKGQRKRPKREKGTRDLHPYRSRVKNHEIDVSKVVNRVGLGTEIYSDM